MTLRNDFDRVNRSAPCPICGKPDWCMIRRGNPRDPSEVICARVESRQRWGDAGWMHVLRDERERRPRQPMRVRIKRHHPSVLDLALHCKRIAEDDHALDVLAEELGVSEDTLHRLGVGFTGWAWTFPMSDATCRVVGLNCRLRDGTKRVVPGHHIGLYLPEDLPLDLRDRSLVICEGGSDAAAAMSMGLDAVGRFSCNTNVDDLDLTVRGRRPFMVIIVADADGPGRKGAERLADALALACPIVKVIEPPAKDLRAWYASGARAREFHSLVAAADPWRIRIGA